MLDNTDVIQRLQHEATPTTVLVAEDDPITRRLLVRFLQKKGHTVLEAEDGEQAWSLYVSHQPKLVITDWRMPRLDGMGLCRRIREQNQDNYTVVLILTSTKDKEAMVQGFAAGADDFMTKPLDHVELQWRIFSGLRVMRLQSTLSNRIQDLVDARSRLQLANEEMREGLDAAAKTQRALLPQATPDVDRISAAWTYQPSAALGGDALNMFKLDDHLMGFFIVDICGHGLPSALLAVSLHRVLTPVLDQPSLLTGDNFDSPLDLFTDPGRVLTELNRRFPMSIEKGEYFTAVYGVIDTRASVLKYAGAGHPNPVIISKDQSFSRLATEGFPVGFDEDVVYETETVSLNPGDRLFVYSDGIAEAQNPEGDMFGIERVAQKLKACAEESLEETLEALVKDVREWEGAAGQEDDMSLVLLEYAGKAAERAIGAINGATDDAQLDRR